MQIYHKSDCDCYYTYRPRPETQTIRRHQIGKRLAADAESQVAQAVFCGCRGIDAAAQQRRCSESAVVAGCRLVLAAGYSQLSPRQRRQGGNGQWRGSGRWRRRCRCHPAAEAEGDECKETETKGSVTTRQSSNSRRASNCSGGLCGKRRIPGLEPHHSIGRICRCGWQNGNGLGLFQIRSEGGFVSAAGWWCIWHQCQSRRTIVDIQFLLAISAVG